MSPDNFRNRLVCGALALTALTSFGPLVASEVEAEPRPSLVIAHTNLPGPDGTGNCRTVVVPDDVVDQNLYWPGSCVNGWGGRKAPKFTLMTTEGRTLEEACEENPDGIYTTWVPGSNGPAMFAVCPRPRPDIPQPNRHDRSYRVWKKLIAR